MYTIFKNDAAIILTDAAESKGPEETLSWAEVREYGLMDKLERAPEGRLWILHDNLQVLWREFSDAFEVVEAAGGVVKNPAGDILFIYRKDRWDLPKGKVEPGETTVETARREVMEECGLADLQVLKYIATTYHIYEEKQKQILKHSHWYEMFTRTIKLVPQTEEGISEAIWSDANTTERLLANTYPNIRLLFGR